MSASHHKAKPDGLLGVSINDARVLLLGLLCTDSSGKIDYNKVAEKGGYKNQSSAYSLYRQVRRKFNEANLDVSGENNGEDSSVSTPKKTLVKRKKNPIAINANTANAEGTAGEASPVTPKPKRQRKNLAKNDAEIKAENEDSGHSDPFIKHEPQAETIMMKENENLHFIVKAEDDEAMAEVDIEAEFNAMEKGKEAAVN